MDKNCFSTPILFLIFNRPEITKRTFNQIKKIKPKFLYIAADGPRDNILGEKEKCEETRKIIEQINRKCEVKTLFREKNLGCKIAVSSAITRFFTQVEQGIILEDDCLPDPSFFPYCDELLNKYKNNEKIMFISGANISPSDNYNFSYFFSKITMVWGWATWKRAWDLYDSEMTGYLSLKESGFFEKEMKSRVIGKTCINNFDEVFYRNGYEWAHIFAYAFLKNNGISIIPSVNLIKNIGTLDSSFELSDSSISYSNLESKKIKLPLKHPLHIDVDFAKDRFIFKNAFKVNLMNVIIGIFFRKIGLYYFFKKIYIKIKGLI